MKKIINILLCTVLCLTLFSGCTTSTANDKSQDKGSTENNSVKDDATKLGNYQIEIMSCRLAKSYDNKDVAIIKYKFINNDDDPTSFYVAVNDSAYQNGVGLNEAYVLDDSANYSSDNQTKDLKKGSSLEVEVAYELNNKTDDILVEVEELISFSDDKISKTFTIK